MQGQWGSAKSSAISKPIPTLQVESGGLELRVRRDRDRKQRGVDGLVQALVRLGVSRVFGIPGGAISPVNDALLDHSSVDVVVTRHEAEAVFAACGHALRTGTVGVAFVTSGPGATNAITGIASAHCDAVPLLILVGEVPRAMQGRGALQDGSTHNLNVVGMMRHVAKAAWEATDSHSLSHLIYRAHALAMDGRRGPVVLTLPLDVQTGPAFEAKVFGQTQTQRTLPNAEMDDLVRRITLAKRPVIFAGNGIRAGLGAQALMRFALHSQIPVMTSPKGKGVFPESHPLSLGVFGIGGHPSARRHLSEGVDFLLALGTSFGDLATESWSTQLYPSRTLVHVDVDGAMLSRNYPADIGIAAPAELVLNALSDRTPARSVGKSFGVQRFTDPATTADGEEGLISPARALWELQRVLPKNTAYAIDSGEHFLFAAHYLEIDQPDGFMAMTGLGSMGQSIGVALGAAMADRTRAQAVVIGDGGLQMIGTQILDAVAARVPLIVVCMNDASLRMCELGHMTVYGRTPSYVTPSMDIEQFARSLGADGLKVEHTGDILRHAALFERRERPLVIDVRIDRSVKIQKKDRIANLESRGGD